MASAGTLRQKPMNTFQSELKAKLKQRQTLGFGHDISPVEESDNGYEDDENDFLSQFLPKKDSSIERRKLRSPLGETLRHSTVSSNLSRNSPVSNTLDDLLENNMKHSLLSDETGDNSQNKILKDRFMKSHKDEVYSSKLKDNTLDELVENNRNQTLLSDEIGDNKKKKNSKDRFLKSYKDDVYSSKKKDEPLTKEEVIFGRKSPEKPGERGGKDKPWTPPSFRKPSKSSTVDSPIEELLSRSVSQVDSDGRQTRCKDPLLESFTGVSPKPNKRSSTNENLELTKHGSNVTSDLNKHRSSESGKRDATNVTPEPKKRSSVSVTPEPSKRSSTSTNPEASRHGLTSDSTKNSKCNTTSDLTLGRPPSTSADKSSVMSAIFGRPQYKDTDIVDDSDDEKKEQQRKEKPKTPDGSKTPTVLRSKSPVVKATPTPTRRRSSAKSDSKSPVMASPIGHGSSSLSKSIGEKEKKNDERQTQKTPSILDFLTGSTTESVSKERKSPKLNKKISKKDDSSDDETEVTLMKQANHHHRRMPSEDHCEDQSSLCDEVQQDPSRKFGTNADKSNVEAINWNQTTDHVEADFVISHIAEAQHDSVEKTIRYIDPADSNHSTTLKSTISNPVKPKPRARYAKSIGANRRRASESFDDTNSIRQAVFREWYMQRTATLKKEKKVKQLKEQEAAKTQEKKKLEKSEESQLSYHAWAEKKKKFYIDKHKKEKQQLEDIARKKREEEENKKKDSETSYETWKDKKDSVIKKRLKEQRNREWEKKTEELQKENEKKAKNQDQYEAWKAKKNDVINTCVQKQKEQEMKEKEEIARSARRRDKQARKLYLEWITKKEIEEKRRREKTLTRRFHSMDEILPPWSPAG